MYWARSNAAGSGQFFWLTMPLTCSTDSYSCSSIHSRISRPDKSARQGFPAFVADRLEAVKWRNWKVVFYDEQKDWWTPIARLGTPKLFNLTTDPKEEHPEVTLRHSWVAIPTMKIVSEFEQSLKKYPPIPPGTADPYTPPKSGWSPAAEIAGWTLDE